VVFTCIRFQALCHLNIHLYNVGTQYYFELSVSIGVLEFRFLNKNFPLSRRSNWQSQFRKMSSNNLQILRPKPRRPFEQISPLLSPLSTSEPTESPSRTQSILNLTSSTLLGIYSDTGGYESDRETPSTPWGTGAETPILSIPSPVNHKKPIPPLPAISTPTVALSLALRSILLFGLGMLYGLLVRHLHDDRQLAPFQVEGIIKPSYDWKYLAFWGAAGLGLGSLLPWVDTLWEDRIEDMSIQSRRRRSRSPEVEKTDSPDTNETLGADWIPVVRSFGAFVGIAYAIRKLPWTSTMQASLTLFLVNPVLWYIIDRSKPGFILSASVGATGTALLLIANPNMLPSPASLPTNSTIEHHIFSDFGLGGESLVNRESVEGGIWILSVLFCSCVCFGNIGRKLALNRVVEQVIGKENKKRKVSGN